MTRDVYLHVLMTLIRMYTCTNYMYMLHIQIGQNPSYTLTSDYGVRDK